MSVNPSEDPSLAYLRALLVAAEGNPALQQSILFASLGGAADAQSSPQRPTLAASSPAPPVRRVSLSGPNGARRSSVRRMSVGEQRQALGPATEQPPRVWPSDARPRKSPERQIEIFVELARAYTWMHGRARKCALSSQRYLTQSHAGHPHASQTTALPVTPSSRLPLSQSLATCRGAWLSARTARPTQHRLRYLQPSCRFSWARSQVRPRWRRRANDRSRSDELPTSVKLRCCALQRYRN